MHVFPGVLPSGNVGGEFLHSFVLEIFQHLGRVFLTRTLANLFYTCFRAIPVRLRRFDMQGNGRSVFVIGDQDSGQAAGKLQPVKRTQKTRRTHEILAKGIDIIVFHRNRIFERVGRIKNRVTVSISRIRIGKIAHKHFLRFILTVGRIYQAGLLIGNMFQPYQTPGIAHTRRTVPDKLYKKALHVC